MTGPEWLAMERWAQGDDCAVVVEATGECVAVLGDPNGEPTREDWARLPLVITAPELLDAIEALMLPLQAALDDGCRIDPADMAATMRKARKVAAKARGLRPIMDHPFDGRGGGRSA